MVTTSSCSLAPWPVAVTPLTPQVLVLPLHNHPPCVQVGSQPRSAAVILLKWRREYYKSREQCCQEQGNKPGCDCEWAGRTWDNLQPPKTWSRIFTDECDKGPSLNRVRVLVVR